MYYLYFKPYLSIQRWNLHYYQVYKTAGEILELAITHYEETPGGESLYAFKFYPLGTRAPIYLTTLAEISGLHIITRGE
jgi:hypothetical protein